MKESLFDLLDYRIIKNVKVIIFDNYFTIFVA